jgi:hypothetical protein
MKRPLDGNIGSPCESESDCVTGLCLTSTGSEFGEGGPAHGWCSAACEDDATRDGDAGRRCARRGRWYCPAGWYRLRIGRILVRPIREEAPARVQQPENSADTLVAGSPEVGDKCTRVTL